jgi:hypothetical protein
MYVPVAYRAYASGPVLVAAGDPGDEPIESKMPTHITNTDDPANAAAMPPRAGVIALNQGTKSRPDSSPLWTQYIVAIPPYTPSPIQLVSIDPVGPKVEADWDNLGSPETYLGSELTRSLHRETGWCPGSRTRTTCPRACG